MTLADSVSQFITDAGLAHQIVNGGPTTVVQTAGGPVASFANIVATIVASATASASAAATSAAAAATVAAAFNSGTAMDCGTLLSTDPPFATFDMGTVP